MNLQQIARVLGGEVVGRDQALVPGPGHSPKDRSLSVKLSATSPFGFVTHSHSGDGWRECRDFALSRLGLSREEWRGKKPQRPRPVHNDGEETKRRECALSIWRESIDTRGTLGEQYLTVERGLPNIIDDTLAQTIKFHPRCPFGKSDRAPALIAALRDVRGVIDAATELGEKDSVEASILRDQKHIVAIHRIRLTQDGKKVDRKSLGPMEGAAAFLSSIWESFYTCSATIGEGVETMLAARTLGFKGCLALCGASRFRTFEPPAHLCRIIIAGENDGASASAWRAAGARWAELVMTSMCGCRRAS